MEKISTLGKKKLIFLPIVNIIDKHRLFYNFRIFINYNAPATYPAYFISQIHSGPVIRYTY